MVCEFIDKNHLYYSLEKFLEEVLYLTDRALCDVYNTINGEVMYDSSCPRNEKGKSKGFWSGSYSGIHYRIIYTILLGILRGVQTNLRGFHGNATAFFNVLLEILTRAVRLYSYIYRWTETVFET